MLILACASIIVVVPKPQQNGDWQSFFLTDMGSNRYMNYLSPCDDFSNFSMRMEIRIPIDSE